jgi:hypothetical protein
MESKEDVTLGGAEVGTDGSWAARDIESLPVKAGKMDFMIPAASAVVVTLHPPWI